MSAAESQDSFQELVSLLITLEKNIILYPPEHESIRKATEALFRNIQALLDKHQSLVLLAAQDRMIINGCQLPPGIARNGMLALFFSQRGILSVSLEQGLTAGELVRFFEILHALPQKSDIQQFPALKEALFALPHIGVRQFELKSLRVQNQDQVEAPGDDQPNENRLEKILLGSAGGTECSDVYRSLYALFPELQPPGEAPVPAAEPDVPVDFDDASLLEALQNDMPEELVLAISMQALNDDRQVSPALQKLLVTLSSIRRTTAAETPAQAGAIGAGAIHKLFEKDQYDNYVSSDYSRQLNRLVQAVESGDTSAVRADWLPEIRETDLDDDYVNLWLVQSLLGLMRAPHDGEILQGCSEQLTLMIPEFLEKRDYSELCSIYATLTSLEAQQNAAVSSCAGSLRAVFSDSSFTERLKRHFVGYAAGTASPEKLEELIYCSGPKNIPWLLELYEKSGDDRQRTRALRLLLNFRNDTAEAVLNRIAGTEYRPDRPLLRLITICGGNPADPRLFPLLDAPEPEVRMEVVRMCLSVGSEAPIPLLVRMIGSKDLAAATLAIRLAGEYRVRALVPKLTRRIKTGYISETAAYRNRVIFESLNKIGDVSVLPSLIRTAAERLSPTPIRLQATQEALFSQLSGYPADALKELIEIGLKSKNPTIHQYADKYKGAVCGSVPKAGGKSR